ALLEHINTPNLTIEEIFKRVRASVVQRSGGKQVPWESTSLTGNFYFKQ
ncbi:MAG: caspase family protein, partial [Bacteroidetes bacterium]